MMDRNAVLERYYLDGRSLVLELAAILDRYERAPAAPGESAASGKQLCLLQQAIQVLAQPSVQPDRTERILNLLSEPIR